MNKTYSVIWSEVRHAYIVVSEYARKGYAKAAMAALAAAVVVSTGMPAALAATPEVNAVKVDTTDNVVVLAEGTTAADLNGALAQIETNTGAIATNTSHIGTNTSNIATNAAQINTNAGNISNLNSELVKTNTTLGTVSSNLSGLNTTVVNGFAALSQADADLQSNINKEVDDRKEADTKLDAALAKETADRIGADKAQDKVIQQINDNAAAGIKAVNDAVGNLNTTVAKGFNDLSQADAALLTSIKEEADARQAADEKEAGARVAADTNLAEAVNGGLSLDGDNVLQKITTSVNTDGAVVTSKDAATQLVLNKGGENQITLSEKGVKVGLNSTVQDANGFYAGGDTAAAAKAALNADGSIKGADGKFTVSTNGNVAATSMPVPEPLKAVL